MRVTLLLTAGCAANSKSRQAEATSPAVAAAVAPNLINNFYRHRHEVQISVADANDQTRAQGLLVTDPRAEHRFYRLMLRG